MDRSSGGRLEPGIGGGDYLADSAAVGLEPWPLSERLERFAEQLAILDRGSRGAPVDSQGRHYPAQGAQLASPVQQPRPPLVIAGQVPGSLRLVARFADAWNTLGGQPLTKPGPRLSVADAPERTREQVQLLEQSCHEIGRNPADILRSVLPYRTETDRLASLGAFEQFVGRYAALGFREFVFYWPPVSNLQRHEPISASQRATLERIAGERLAARRDS